MLRIRHADGRVTPVPADGAFVEICDESGAIGMVFFQTPGMIVQVQPGSVDAARYEDMFRSVGVKFNQIMIQRR